MLDGGSRGQDVVGHEGRGRHDELEHDDEVHGAEGIHDELRIGIGNQRIGPIDDERAYAIGLPVMAASHTRCGKAEVRYRMGR